MDFWNKSWSCVISKLTTWAFTIDTWLLLEQSGHPLLLEGYWKKSLWLRSIRRQVISDRYYFGCLLFLGCFEWLCNQVFLKAIVFLMRAERNQYFCVKRGCFVCKSFTVVTIISKIQVANYERYASHIFVVKLWLANLNGKKIYWCSPYTNVIFFFSFFSINPPRFIFNTRAQRTLKRK